MSKKSVQFNIPYTHLKTGKTYWVADQKVIACTGDEVNDKVLYTDGELLFEREVSEFNQKFKLADGSNSEI